MRHSRVRRFPEPDTIEFIDWEISPGVCAETKAFDGQHAIPVVRFELTIPGYKRPVRFSVSPEDAYELREDIGRAYDQAIGI